MTTKSAFSEGEWSRIVRAPMVAGLAISVADSVCTTETAKESMAAIRSTVNPPAAKMQRTAERDRLSTNNDVLGTQYEFSRQY